jgi:hypothetical protein
MLTAVIAMIISVPLLGFVSESASAEDEDKKEFVSFYNQLDANSKEVYDSLKGVTAESLTVTVQLKNPVYTIKNTDGSAEAFLMNEITGIVNSAYYALKMQEPLAISTWGKTTLSFDKSAQSFEDGGETVGLKSVKITVVMDAAYADNPETADVNELQVKVDELNKAIKDYNAGSDNVRSIVGNVNGYLTSRLAFDKNEGTDKENPYAHDAYGALVASGKTVVNDGFSKGFQALCQKYSIECYTIIGYTVPEMKIHTWNVVKMDNGKMYPVDVTANNDKENSQLLPSAESFNKGHVPGIQTSDGGITFDYPALGETKYDADPWYSNKYVEYAFLAAIGGLIIVGLYMAVLQDKKKKA